MEEYTIKIRKSGESVIEKTLTVQAYDSKEARALALLYSPHMYEGLYLADIYDSRGVHLGGVYNQ